MNKCYSMKVKALEFSSKNMTKWLMKSLCGFQYTLNLLHSWRMYCLDSIGYDSHRHLNSSLKKNPSLYSPIRAWFVIVLEALAHKELKWLKIFNQAPALMYNGSIILSLPSSKLRNWLLLRSDVWNVIFHLSSHSLSLLKSHDILHGKGDIGLKDFVSLSTALCRIQLLRLEHSQNLMELSWWHEKKDQSSLSIVTVWTWKGWVKE